MPTRTRADPVELALNPIRLQPSCSDPLPTTFFHALRSNPVTCTATRENQCHPSGCPIGSPSCLNQADLDQSVGRNHAPQVRC
eukprot:m.44925 g.44925  ORF g.44925 m.44925 type:complete len:83 (-) comp47124_c0_seq1:15-263(-)